MSAQVEIMIIAVIVAVACTIPGVFLVLRKMSMMADAITHTILLGIIMVFLMVQDLNSPFLIIGAALIGVFTVYLVEMLNKTRLLSEDSAIGIVFPLLFSIAIILISRYAGQAHIDTDSVLLGEIAFAPFNRLVIAGFDIGPKSMYTMGMILIINVVLVTVFFKELKIAVFDAGLASVLGFSPLLIQYTLMASVSVTIVGAFEAVGSILVIAFMIGPAISAYLLTDDLKIMLVTSALIGAFNAITGFYFALAVDVSIAGSMAMMTGITFLLVLVFAPKRGLLTVFRRRRIQKVEFSRKAILFHIYNHEGNENEAVENGVDSIYEHLNMTRDFINSLLKALQNEKILVLDNKIYKLTPEGRKYTISSYEDIVESYNVEYED